jgi:hypothetical protein
VPSKRADQRITAALELTKIELWRFTNSLCHPQAAGFGLSLFIEIGSTVTLLTYQQTGSMLEAHP